MAKEPPPNERIPRSLPEAWILIIWRSRFRVHLLVLMTVTMAAFSWLIVDVPFPWRDPKGPEPDLAGIDPPAPLPNYFLNVRSPEGWFNRSQSYRRTEIDKPRHERSRVWALLSLARRYLSDDHDDTTGPFGRGWHHQYQSAILIPSSRVERILYRDQSGEIVEFEPIDMKRYLEALRSYVPEASSGTSLASLLDVERDSTYFLSEMSERLELRYIGISLTVAELAFVHEHIRISVPGGRSYFFDREGRLEEIKDPSHHIELRYKPSDPSKLERVTASVGERYYVELDYKPTGRIASATYGDGTKYTYDYDDRSRLTEVLLDENAHLSYGYDESDRLSLVREETKADPLTIKYDGGQRVGLQRGDETIRWDFDSNSKPRKTVLTRRRGALPPDKVSFVFDKEKLSLTMTDSHGGDGKEYWLTACGCNPKKVVEAQRETNYDYNTLGQITQITSNAVETSFGYHLELHQITSRTTVKMPSREVTETYTFKYDGQGQLKTATDRSGEIILLTYDTAGDVETISSNRDENTYRFSYGVEGKPTLIEVEGLGSISINYDAEGGVSSVVGQSELDSFVILTPLRRLMKILERRYKLPIDRDFTEIDATL